MKTCAKCGEAKAPTEFGRDKHAPDGLCHSCKACRNSASAAWRRANPEKAAAIFAKHCRANPEKRAALAANYHQANKDEINARHTALRQANPHIGWESLYRQRCRKFGITIVVEPFTYDDVIDRYGDGCFYCDGGDFEVIDHSHTVAAGGGHTLDNVRPSCAPCNGRKQQAKDMTLIKVYRTIAAAIAAHFARAA